MLEMSIYKKKTMQPTCRHGLEQEITGCILDVSKATTQRMLCPRNLNKINHNIYNKVNPRLQKEY